MRAKLVKMLLGLAALASVLGAARASALEPLAEAARREGSVTLYSNNLPQLGELLDQFQATYPSITVNYVKFASSQQYDTVVRDVATGQGTADLLLSSGMDLQVKLVNDGYALSYDSPEAAHLPDWLKWQNMAYGVTAEPVVIVYNKNLVPPADVPRSHSDLTHLLATQEEHYRGKVATFDVERSSTGLLFATQDVQVTAKSWDLFRAMGQVGVKVYAAASAMLDRVAAGDQYLAYNVIGSYAFERAPSQPSLGVVIPADYTLLMSRIAIIPKAAKHPNAGKLLLDFMLSRRGQQLLAAHFLGPVRDDVVVDQLAIPAAARIPIHVGPALLTYLDQAKNNKFLKDWRHALQGG